MTSEKKFPCGMTSRPHAMQCTGVVMLVLFCSATATAELNLPYYVIQRWAEVLGHKLYEACAKATAITDIRADYLLMDPRVRVVEGHVMVNEMRQNIELMLRKKKHAVQRLVKVAETAYKNHEYDKDIQISYHMAKKLNTSEFVLEENEHFNYISVNLNQSTVHVPTNVYEQSAEVLNGVAWSEQLDSTFKNNSAKDPTLTWQYFGSATGFLRNYPGTLWRTKTFVDEQIDVYDCRVRGWYIRAAASPKDVVILLDVSGSMKGLRIEIAKATVEKILDTLTDDDFFNVIMYSDGVEYAELCFNATLVQATRINKERAANALLDVRTQHIARLDLALVEAFELLNATSFSGRGSLCNRAIMVVTDGSPETYEAIFEKYNAPNPEVRVFTFLIGREVGDSWQTRWMACSNKGRFAHIASLADVHEHVQGYINVLSRPVVISRAEEPVWTNVYVDSSDALATVGRPAVLYRDRTAGWTKITETAMTDRKDGQGLHLMTTVSQPVYDTKNDTTRAGKLLGVMGTDVPLKEITKLTPAYKLGVNGYSFAVTNNGYVIFHPRFDPVNGDTVKPNFNSVDLDDIELLDVHAKLRKRMVERHTGSIRLKAHVQYDNNKRASERQYHYYFTSIPETPFSLGIALPNGYGQYVVDGRRHVTEASMRLPDDRLADLTSLNAREVVIAPWNYCKMETPETKQDPVEMLIRYLTRGRDDINIYQDKCDRELLESLMFDAEATRGAMSGWLKENVQDTPNGATFRRNGVQRVFIGTKGGLTRHMTLVDNPAEPDFINEHRSTIEELYYQRAVENGEFAFTFSVPFSNGSTKFQWARTVVTASTPLMVSEDGRDAVAAVVGLQMNYNKFYEFFVNSTQVCPRDFAASSGTAAASCNLTCASPEINCYLLDNNGYVVLSETPREIGQLYGQFEGSGEIMRQLTIDDDSITIRGTSPKPKGVFKRLQVPDRQAICDIMSKPGSNAESLFSAPARAAFSAVTYAINQLALMLTNIPLFLSGWWRSVASFDYYEFSDIHMNETFGEAEEYDDTEIDYDFLYDIGTQAEVRVWLNQLRVEMYDGPKEGMKQRAVKFLENLRRREGPRVIGQRPCTKLYSHYIANFSRLPHWHSLQHCMGGCSKAYSIHHVPKTNLMLLAVDATCDCSDTTISAEPIELSENETETCEKLQQDIYRRRPSHCIAHHPDEDASDCGRACGLVRPTVLFVVLLTALTLAVTILVVDGSSSVH